MATARRRGSLLDRGPHTVIVTPRTATTDSYKATLWHDGEPVAVRASVQPVRAAERVDLGLTTTTVYRVLARIWPGGVSSRVEWDGRDWEQVGEALHHSTGRRTTHVEVLIRAKGGTP